MWEEMADKGIKNHPKWFWLWIRNSPQLFAWFLTEAQTWLFNLRNSVHSIFCILSLWEINRLQTSPGILHNVSLLCGSFLCSWKPLSPVQSHLSSLHLFPELCGFCPEHHHLSKWWHQSLPTCLFWDGIPVYTWLPWNSLCSQGWPWTTALPASTSECWH